MKRQAKDTWKGINDWFSGLVTSLADILTFVVIAMAMMLSDQLWGWSVTRAIFGMLSLVLLACFIMSFTEKGPFTQLPKNTVLRRKTGDRKNLVGYYINGENLAIDKNGRPSVESDGAYQRKLRSGPLGLIFRMLGMVYTGFPFIGGVTGMKIRQSELKFTQNDDGTVSTKTDEVDNYYTAIPVYIRRAITYGGIPIKDKNLLDFSIATTLLITDFGAIDTKVTDDGSFKALKGTLESALRPEVEKMDLEEALRIRSEFLDHTKKTNEDEPAGRVIKMTNKNMNSYGYGLNIQDMDIPLVQPSDKAYAKAERAKGLAAANAEANTVVFENKAKEITTLGKANAEARRALMDASVDPTMALFAEGMGKVQPGATIVIGGGVMPTIPLPQTKP